MAAPDPDSSPTPGENAGAVPKPFSPRPGSHPSDSHYAAELPYPEELQAFLGGAYIVESFLGEGGMGAVYKGLQMPLKRPVAIKILAKRGVDDDFAFEERFKREAYAMASLTHPNIVHVYDCGDAGENFLFISMELVDGGDLSEAIKAGKITPEAALKLIPQICDGLQAAHERGIVHRDIKPANIFLTADGRAKVADFGLAKKFDSKSTFVTRTGLGMGTPDYAAPEQYEGTSDIDHRADIYSLGVMTYQMLTGKLPRGMAEPPSAIMPGLDPRFDAIVQRAMKEDRDLRYQSAAEFCQTLDEISTARPSLGASAQRSGAVPVPTPRAHTPAPRQQPAARVPQRQEGSAGTPARHAPGTADRSVRAPVQETVPGRSKMVVPMVLGAVALIGVVAFFLMGGKSEVARHSDVEKQTPPAQNPTSESRATPAAKPVTASTTPGTPASSTAKSKESKSDAKNAASTTTATTASATPKAEAPKPAVAAKSNSAPVIQPPAGGLKPSTTLAGAAVPPSSSAAKGPQPARLPDPATWVKVFETKESLSPFGSAAQWTNDGIHLTHKLVVPSAPVVDAGVRAKFRVRYDISTVLMLRESEKGGVSASFRPQQKSVVLTTIQGKVATDLARFPTEVFSAETSEVQLEFIAVGKVLQISQDGKVLGSVTQDAEPVAGRVGVYSTGGLVRDIAWQSLEAPNPADEKLAALESAYQHRIKSEADAPFDAAVAELGAKLKGAIERTLPTVRGTSTEALLRAEISRIEKKEPIPPADEPKIPAMLVTLRKTWHMELAKLFAVRTQNGAAARQAYGEGLAALKKELEEKGDITRAERVKQAQAALQKGPALPVAEGLAATKKTPINVRPTKAGRLKMIGCIDNAGVPLNAEPFANFDDFVQVIANRSLVAALRSDGSVIVQRHNKEASPPLQTFTHANPPMARILSYAFSSVVWGLTEDGHAVRMDPGGKQPDGLWSEWENLVDFSGEADVCAGVKADGTLVLACSPKAAAESQWLPAADSVAKVKRVSCSGSFLLLLMQDGTMKGWLKPFGELKPPLQLRNGIERMKSAAITLDKAGKEPIWQGLYLNRQRDYFLMDSSGIYKSLGKDVEDFRGVATGMHRKPAGKPWVIVNAPGNYGELTKAQEVLAKGTPIDWDNFTGVTSGIFIWIE